MFPFSQYSFTELIFVLISCGKYRFFCVMLFMAFESFVSVGVDDFILTDSFAFFFPFFL